MTPTPSPNVGTAGEKRGSDMLTPYPPTRDTRPEEPTVAVVLDADGRYIDRCFTWEAGQNYALHEGLRVVAVADDGHMTMAEAQTLYDAELARYRDCFGVEG